MAMLKPSYVATILLLHHCWWRARCIGVGCGSPPPPACLRGGPAYPVGPEETLAVLRLNESVLAAARTGTQAYARCA